MQIDAFPGVIVRFGTGVIPTEITLEYNGVAGLQGLETDALKYNAVVTGQYV
jgi:hypothetical protein